MLLLRPPVLLLLLLVDFSSSSSSSSSAVLGGSISHMRSRIGTGIGTGTGTRTMAEAPGRMSAARLPGRGSRTQHGAGGNHRDPHHKDKFIIHLTGPLYFDPKCKKQFQRLYHNTRDCTVPTYYRRCARLLQQLAKSPRCAER